MILPYLGTYPGLWCLELDMKIADHLSKESNSQFGDSVFGEYIKKCQVNKIIAQRQLVLDKINELPNENDEEAPIGQIRLQKSLTCFVS